MAHAEAMRETFKKLRYITKQEDISVIKRIDAPATTVDGTPETTETGQEIMRTIYDPKDVELQQPQVTYD
jgi:hypothetical protein